jgi:hypothetical protein
MLSGPPLPLRPDFPLARLAPLLPAGSRVGAWVQAPGSPLELRIRSRPGRGLPVLLASDLGYLLRRRGLVVVRVGEGAELLAAEELIRCRALQVVTGTPYLPSPDQLKSLFPEVTLQPSGFSVLLCERQPEEVLGLCLSHDIPVLESRISYRA